MLYTLYLAVLFVATLSFIIFLLNKEWSKKVRIITFSGPSGAGKTTIVWALLKRHPDWKMVVSLTSREPRDSDLSGEYRCGVSKDEFLKLEREGKFMWTAFPHGNMYGTLLSDICKALKSKTPSLMQLTVSAVKSLHAYAPREVLSIFVLPPDETELRHRLEQRGERPEAIERRVSDCKEWINEALLSNIPFEFVRNDGTIVDFTDEIERVIQRYI